MSLRNFGLSLLCVLVTTATAVPAFAGPSRTELQTMYVDFLKGEGYLPKVDEDGDVMFKIEGKAYWILVDEKDLGFFRLMRPNIWSVDSEAERAKIALAASYASNTTKVAKVYLTTDNTTASAEIYIPAPEDFKEHFSRLLSSLNTAIGKFKKKMDELK